MGFRLSTRTSHIRQNLIPNGPVALCCPPVVYLQQPSSWRKEFFMFVRNMQLTVYADESWHSTLSVPWEEFVPLALMLRNTPSPRFIYTRRLTYVLRISVISACIECTNNIMQCSKKITTLQFNVSYLIFVVPCIMLNSEISPTRCNNCVYSSQWLFTLHVSGDNSTHHQEYNAVYGLSGRQVYFCCNFVNILVVLSLSVVLSCRWSLSCYAVLFLWMMHGTTNIKLLDVNKPE